MPLVIFPKIFGSTASPVVAWYRNPNGPMGAGFMVLTPAVPAPLQTSIDAQEATTRRSEFFRETFKAVTD